ncbi:MAG: acetyltransferase [Gammaproteobacteria bacterium]|nr:acetyltransferase [Gammaproteobacteria bacterium]
MKLYAIVGAGGFGREVMPLAEVMLNTQLREGKDKLVFVVENKNNESFVNQYPVLSVEEFFSYSASEHYFNIAIAQHAIRKRISEKMLSLGAKPFRINAGNFIELHGNVIQEGAIFCPFTMVTSNATIGKYFHANIYSYVAHDCVIGDYVTFAPHVQCNGNVIIEDEVYVGTGVIIREGTAARPMIIGRGSVLGMGAVITKSVPPFVTVVGNPAKILQPVTPQATSV